MYRKYGGLVQAMVNRHHVYNDTLDFIEHLEQERKAFVLRPSQPVQVDRLEKNERKLTGLYDLGYKDANAAYEKIAEWIAGPHT